MAAPRNEATVTVRERLRGLPKTPTILQMEAAECGAASLAMVLAYHGRWVPLEELRVACGVSRDGSKASNILKAARAQGMSAKGFKKEPENLTSLPCPSIIHWNFNHFVVFEGFRRNRAWINDPAGGRQGYLKSEFSEKFTGVVLAMTPGEAFTRGGPKPEVYAPLLRFLAGSRGSVILIALFSALLILPGLMVPGLSKLFVDKVLSDRLSNWLGPLCLVLAGMGLLQAGIVWLQRFYLLRLESRLTAVLSGRVMFRMLALPMAFFNQRHAGELSGRVACADNVAALLSGQVAATAFNTIAVFAYGAAMLAFDPVVAGVAVMVPVLNLLLLRTLRVRVRDLNRRVAVDQGKLLGVTTSTIMGIETLKVSGNEGEAFAYWAGHQARAANSTQALGVINSIAGVAPQILNGIAVIAVLTVGGLRVMDGVLTIGSLVALQVLMASFVGPFTALVELSHVFQQVQGDLGRISDLLNHGQVAGSPSERGPSTRAPPARMNGRLELRDICFGYSRADPPLIRNFSMVLEPGRRIALIGGSGSGKSTIGRLVAGLIAPWSGEIRLDGEPIETLTPAERAAVLAYVDQDVFLFAGTVRDNMTLWDRTVSDGVLIEALKDAGIHADVASRPGGLDAVISEGGINLSGGQRQRLEIARALAANPAVLVLDEATAALDPITELLIDGAIRRRGCACLIIAHRLSTIRDADEILVLDGGQLTERGSHAELMTRGGAYAGLIGATV
ncbi:MAG: hypothetical protein QOG73_3196 [Acetobacteraceae bacterium]|nr:hypothetical protein [Acetobacteraceae bacterium]